MFEKKKKIVRKYFTRKKITNYFAQSFSLMLFPMGYLFAQGAGSYLTIIYQSSLYDQAVYHKLTYSFNCLNCL